MYYNKKENSTEHSGSSEGTLSGLLEPPHPERFLTLTDAYRQAAWFPMEEAKGAGPLRPPGSTPCWFEGSGFTGGRQDHTGGSDDDLWFYAQVRNHS